MHQYARLGDVIGMVVLNLEVIDLDRAFQQFMLNLLYNDIFAVDENQNIPGTKMHCIRPAFDRAIERVRRCCNNLLAVYKYMHQLIRFIDIGFQYPLQRNIIPEFVPCPDVIANFYRFNCSRSICRLYKCSTCKN